MLREIAADVVQFLSRRDLDKACAVSKWLDALIAQSCAVYPLRSVQRIALWRWKDSTLNVSINYFGTEYSFNTMDEAMHFATAFLRKSYVWRLEVGGGFPSSSIPLIAHHWTSLLNGMRSAAVRHIEFDDIDFSASDDDTFLAAVSCRGLKSFAVRRCAIPSGFISDTLIRASVANGVFRLRFFNNRGGMPLGPSDDAILDFCFPAKTAPEGQWRSLMIEYSGVTDLFLTKFFERLQSGHVRPAGNLKFIGGPPKQRGLSVYAQHLAPDRRYGTDDHYRFPPVDNNSKPYEVVLYESHVTEVCFAPCRSSDHSDEEDEIKSFRDRKVKEEEDEEAQEMDKQEKEEVAYWTEGGR